jgi:hypothetical protein
MPCGLFEAARAGLFVAVIDDAVELVLVDALCYFWRLNTAKFIKCQLIGLP